jgi:hypothetical protein
VVVARSNASSTTARAARAASAAWRSSEPNDGALKRLNESSPKSASRLSGRTRARSARRATARGRAAASQSASRLAAPPHTSLAGECGTLSKCSAAAPKSISDAIATGGLLGGAERPARSTRVASWSVSLASVSLDSSSRRLTLSFSLKEAPGRRFKLGAAANDGRACARVWYMLSALASRTVRSRGVVSSAISPDSERVNANGRSGLFIQSGLAGRLPWWWGADWGAGFGASDRVFRRERPRARRVFARYSGHSARPRARARSWRRREIGAPARPFCSHLRPCAIYAICAIHAICSHSHLQPSHRPSLSCIITVTSQSQSHSGTAPPSQTPAASAS